MTGRIRCLAVLCLAAMLCFGVAPVWSQGLILTDMESSAPETVELIPLAETAPADEEGLSSGFAAIQIENECTNLVCVSIIQNPGDPEVWCEDCNGCEGIHASNWSTSADSNVASGYTICAYGGGGRPGVGLFECKADSAGVICKDCGSCLLDRNFC